MNIDFCIKFWACYFRIEEMHFIPEFCQLGNRFTDVVIDIAEFAEALETEIEDSKFIFNHYRVHLSQGDL